MSTSPGGWMDNNKKIGLALVLVAAVIAAAGCAPQERAAASPEVPGSSGTPPVIDKSAPRFVPGEYLVRFKSGVSKSSATGMLAKASVQSAAEFRSVPGLHLVRVVGGSQAESQFKARIAADPEVEYLEPNFIQRAFAAPNDPDYPRLWAMNNTNQTGSTLPYQPDIGAEEAWDITTGSDDVVVAVIDSGVDYTHEDLAANIWRNEPECVANGVDDDGNGFIDDCHGIDPVGNDSDPMDEATHGTHVAGTIGAVGNNGIGIAGVAWRVKIMPCRFLDSSGSGSTADALRCLDYIALMKQRGVNIIATNNSWGSITYSRALEDGIRAQRDRGILFVAAAGNDFQLDVDVVPRYPCAHEVTNIICVASAYESVDFFSNYGRGVVLIGAPGSGIYSTVPGNRYDWKDGTSMATPHVVGALVLLKAQDPTRNQWALRNLIAVSAQAPREYSIPSIADGRLRLPEALTCSDRTILARLRPMTFTPLIRPPGGRVTISALHARCASANGNVTVSVAPSGESVILRDDGIAPDEIAGDAVYSGEWVAGDEGEYTFSFPAPETETFRVKVDPLIKPGFPRLTETHGLDDTQYTYGSAGGGGEVVVGNIVGDARLEIVSLARAYGPATAWNSSGELLPGWPTYAFGEVGGLTLGNFDDNASDLEVVPQFFFNMRILQGDGSEMPGWVDGIGAGFNQFAAVDIDGDGIDELIGSPARRADGTPFRSDIPVPARPSSPEAGIPYTARSGDLDADGRPDFIATLTRNSATDLWVSDADGLRAGFPLPVPGGINTVGAIRPLIGDVDGDGMPNILLASIDYYPVSRGQVQIFDNRGRLLRTIYQPEFVSDGMSLADLDGDGVPEILRAGENSIRAWRGDGSELPGWPRTMPGIYFGVPPAVGDVDGDGAVDVVAVGYRIEPDQTGTAFLYALRADGSYLPGMPHELRESGPGSNTPVIADIDQDGRNDIVINFGRGLGKRETLFAFHLGGSATNGVIEWSQESGSARHAGYYETGKNLPNHAYLATQVYGAGRINANGGGISCRGDCIERYAKGTNVVLTATANAGGTFARWRGACATQGNPCTLPVSRFTETSADFDSLVTVGISGPGTVRSSVVGINCPGDCSETYPARSMVTLTADTQGGFLGWTGACAASGPICTLFIDDAKETNAIFVADYPLTITTSGSGTALFTSSVGGINCGSICTTNLPVRSTVRLTVVPAADTQFVGWNRAGCPDYILTCDVQMNIPVTLNATLALKPMLSVSIIGSGSLRSDPPGAVVCSAASCQVPMSPGPISLTAQPASGHHFLRFEGLCSQQGVGVPICNHSVTGNAAITVVFEPDYALNVARAGTGSGTIRSSAGEFVCPSNCAPTFPPGRIITMTATADSNSSFDGWSGACSGTGSCVVTVNSITGVTATFTRTAPPPGNGNGNPGGGKGGGRGGVLELAALALILSLRLVERLVDRLRRRREPDGLLGTHVQAVLETDAELAR